MSIVQKHKCLNEAIKQALDENASMQNLSSEILQKVVIETIHKYQQKLNVGIEDSLSDLIAAFKQKISDTIFETTAGWRVHNRDYFLFPRGCRFCFAKGDSIIVVIEQEPQIRSLLLSSALLNSKNSERVALALPYVNFVLHFKKNVFASMFCGWRTTPLRDISDSLCTPLLPNIHDNLAVCMGKVTGDLGDNISQRTDAVLNHFWNSQFNTDLSQNWNVKARYHSNFETAQKWSKASIDDSNFVLQINYKQTKTLKSIVDLLTKVDDEPDETILRHNLSEYIDQTVESLFAKILRYFKNTKFEKHHPKDITDLMSKIMTESNSELASLILVIENELGNLKKEIQTINLLPNAVPRSPRWSNYST